MTDNWLNTRAGQVLANQTIPNLTKALNRLSDKIGGSEIHGSPPCEFEEAQEIHWRTQKEILPSFWKQRQEQVGEIQRVLRWEPSQLEILLYRALSRAYCAPRGVMEEGDDAFDEAYAALATASNDFRNSLTCHTFVSEEEIADDNPQRIDWEYEGDKTSP